MSRKLHELFETCGQSPWLDNIQRSHIESGHLASMRDLGVRGLTSNPAIFQKAIKGSSDYDNQFRTLVQAGESIESSYWQMVITDISCALEIFRPVYDASSGGDGFVSVEVDPRLAHDTAGTIAAARWLKAQIPHPNVMIKVPATKAGLPAIEQLISEGCNVNVTLIFSLPRYGEVIDAYLSGLERYLTSSVADASRIASVASFFISRVDSEIDPILDANGASHLQGRAAINQGILAYDLFRQRFSGDRWEYLRGKGANVQRPLWASTSTKNPAYPDTLYVDTLIGPDTVNTLPEATLEAFADHGCVSRTIDSELETAKAQWSALSGHGVDVESVSLKLEKEGVDAFINSFDDLLESLSVKARSFS